MRLVICVRRAFRWRWNWSFHLFPTALWLLSQVILWLSIANTTARVQALRLVYAIHKRSLVQTIGQ